nr:putative late blight resistance protein homolog R1B-16 isoform X1 [Ipomoea batatas]
MNPNNHIGRLENLKKLVVCDFPFGWKAINSLSKLPKLEVLKLLRCIRIDEEEWKLSKNEKFEQLVYLKIDAIYLKCWEASAYHFPNLECLILSCEKLEEIPANFAEISNLKCIKLIGCLTSAVASAKQILEEQHDQGNDDMIVIEKYTIEENVKVANRRPILGIGWDFKDFNSPTPLVSLLILELGGLDDEEVFLLPEDLAVGDDYYPGSGNPGVKLRAAEDYSNRTQLVLGWYEDLTCTNWINLALIPNVAIRQPGVKLRAAEDYSNRTQLVLG